MKKWLFALLIGTALVLGACGGGADDASEEPADNGDTGTEESTEGGTVDVAAAEEVYQSNCASCHGADLSGASGPGLQNVGSDHSADDIAAIIENGQGSMPAGMASGDDVDLLANWLAEKE
ncbi:cytochrome c [Virgibacillus sp. C22-A2]|uniref:Cytochrome c n=1 Tax=Virgibacillus tibetensis TaxID=3042313 RepID=A0ABU6KBZ2_9BACI|nr:cytochrome c [Virgibacillus sp. C22-A2]